MRRWGFRFAMAIALLRVRRRRRKRKRRKADALTIAEQGELLDAMVGFSETQILGQVADEASIDGRTMGVLAFAGALLGGTLAARDLLGPLWWTPLIPVAAASGWCLWSVKKQATAYGPYALSFYERFGGLGPLLARTQLLADLDRTFKLNEVRVANKQKRLRRSLVTLVVGLAIAGLLIAVDRPTTITSLCTHAQIRAQGHHLSRCRPLRTSRSSGQAGSSAAATTRATTSTTTLSLPHS